jgi:E3 ubiquitin-protein ligase listerin
LSLLLDAPKINDYQDADLELFPVSVRRYLLSWHLVFDSFSSASNVVRLDYSDEIKTGGYLSSFLEFMFDALGHSAATPLKLDREHIDDSMIRKYDMWVATDSQSLERDMHWLLVNLYYLCLKYIPGEVKNWWLNCKDRQTSIAVLAWTEKYFSTLIVQDLLDEVSQWSETQDGEPDGEKKLQVKVSKNSREVSAGYEIDDMEMKMVIRMPAMYPLSIVTVESINRVAIPAEKWQTLLRSTQGRIQFAVSLHPLYANLFIPDLFF